VTAEIGFSSVSAEFEQSFARSLSVFLGPTFSLGWANKNGERATLYTAGGRAGLRVFFSQRAPKGTWFSLQGELLRAWGRFDNGDRVSANGSAYALMFGYTWIFGSAFVLSIGGGLQYVAVDLGFPEANLGFRGLLPAFRGAIGYAF